MAHEYNSPARFSLSDINLFWSHKYPSPGWSEGNFGTTPVQDHPLKSCPGHQVKAMSIFLCTSIFLSTCILLSTCCMVLPFSQVHNPQFPDCGISPQTCCCFSQEHRSKNTFSYVIGTQTTLSKVLVFLTSPWASEKRPNGLVWAHQESETILFERDPSGSSNPTSGPAQNTPRIIECASERCPNTSWTLPGWCCNPGELVQETAYQSCNQTLCFSWGKQNRRWTKENRAWLGASLWCIINSDESYKSVVLAQTTLNATRFDKRVWGGLFKSIK